MTDTAPTSTRAPFSRTVRGTGPGLLLAHGAGGGIEANYGPLMEMLATRHTVVGVDYPGSGTTPVSAKRLGLDQLADQLIMAADAEKLDTFALCGYSLGSAVAVRVAARHPDRVTALVLTAPFAHLDTRTALASAIWQQLYDSGQHLLLAQYLTLLTLSPALTNSLSLEQILAGHQQGGFNVPEGTGAQVDLVRRSDIRDDLAGITAPTLVVVTTADPLIPAQLQHQVAAGIPGAKTADLGTGHLPFLEQPARWLEIITDFLDGVGA